MTIRYATHRPVTSDARQSIRRLSTAAEAFVLSFILAVVAVGGGLRLSAVGLGGFSSPRVVSFVLAVGLVALLAKAHALLPIRFPYSPRLLAQNLSAIVLLVMLFGASAQVLNNITPTQPLLALVFHVFMGASILQLVLVTPPRRRLAGCLAILIGGAFFVRHVAVYQGGTSVPAVGLAAVTVGLYILAIVWLCRLVTALDTPLLDAHLTASATSRVDI